MKRLVFGSVMLALGLLGGCAKDADNGTQNISPAIKSKRGESCAATNDCDKSLICVSNHCIQNDFPVSAQAKECAIIGCESDADCCDDFTPAVDCDTYQAQCDLGDTLYCQYFDLYCVCQQECRDEQCVTVQPACTDDIDCGGYFCVDEQCVQCATNEDCGTDLACNDGFCQGACTQDEECPIFSACEDGDCVETGCRSDRECILFTGDAQSQCTDDAVCKTPCESNAQCGDLQICTAGACEFIGCEADADCRAYFAHQLVTIPVGASVVCREMQ
jgi:hypothetical protein